jgi:hypothetical protein
MIRRSAGVDLACSSETPEAWLQVLLCAASYWISLLNDEIQVERFYEL